MYGLCRVEFVYLDSGGGMPGESYRGRRKATQVSLCCYIYVMSFEPR